MLPTCRPHVAHVHIVVWTTRATYFYILGVLDLFLGCEIMIRTCQRATGVASDMQPGPSQITDSILQHTD